MTQGLVSVVANGQVLMKIIAGSDGHAAKKVAAQIKREWPVNLERAFEIAAANDFGIADEDLVVMDGARIIFKGDEDVHPRYRETFENPHFNPRWAVGIADYTELVAV